MEGAAYDVVVVGAGLMGSAAAYNIAKAGKRVILLEQYHFLHRRGSSHGESRIIRRTYPSAIYTSLMSTSYLLWREAEADGHASVLHTTGGIDVVPAASTIFDSLIHSCESNMVSGASAWPPI